jgi:hypothetical protein
MDQQTLLIVLTIFVAVAALALVIQMATLLGLFVVTRRLHAQVTAVWPDVQAILGVTRRTVENVEKHVDTAGKHLDKIGETSSSILESARQQVVKIDELITDATTRAKVQIERTEMILDDTMGRYQETISIVQRTILRPLREVYGLLSGIRASIAHLGRGGRRRDVHLRTTVELVLPVRWRR